MKTLRYLLSVIAIMGVLGVSAQTPKYGKSYNPQNSSIRVINAPVDAQMPEATMGSVDAGYMQSGSNLPMAAQSGVTTTYDKSNGPRKIGGGNSGGGSGPENPDDPWATPIGDAMWPMMMLALAYAIYKVSRMRRREEGC